MFDGLAAEKFSVVLFRRGLRQVINISKEFCSPSFRAEIVYYNTRPYKTLKLCCVNYQLQQMCNPLAHHITSDTSVLKALRSKLEGHGFDTRCGELLLSMYLIFQPQ
jgi:hypothetical protein